MRELENLLPDLAPPFGGLERLQRTLAATLARSHARRWRWALGAAACIVAAAVALWLPHEVMRQRQAAQILQAMEQTDSPAAGIRVAGGAAIELPSGQANVKLYLVEAGR